MERHDRGARAYWLQAAGTAVPAEAWAHYLRGKQAPATGDTPTPKKPIATIDPRWWSLGVVDGFRGTHPQHAVVDQFSYFSGRVEGQAAKEQGRTIDDVLQKYGVPYRESHFRPAHLNAGPSR